MVEHPVAVVVVGGVHFAQGEGATGNVAAAFAQVHFDFHRGLVVVVPIENAVLKGSGCRARLRVEAVGGVVKFAGPLQHRGTVGALQGIDLSILGAEDHPIAAYCGGGVNGPGSGKFKLFSPVAQAQDVQETIIGADENEFPGNGRGGRNATAGGERPEHTSRGRV